MPQEAHRRANPHHIGVPRSSIFCGQNISVLRFVLYCMYFKFWFAAYISEFMRSNIWSAHFRLTPIEFQKENFHSLDSRNNFNTARLFLYLVLWTHWKISVLTAGVQDMQLFLFNWGIHIYYLFLCIHKKPIYTYPCWKRWASMEIVY